MSGFKEPNFADRQKAAAEARQKILDKFRARPAADDPAIKAREAERALADEKERLTVTLRSVGDGVITTDLSGTILSMNKVAEALRTVPEAVDVQQQNPTGIPKLMINLRRDALLRWGFNPLDVLDAVRTAFQGDQIGPTRAANLWHTQHTVLVEAGGSLGKDPGRWARLVHHVTPNRWQATLTGRAQAGPLFSREGEVRGETVLLGPGGRAQGAPGQFPLG